MGIESIELTSHDNKRGIIIQFSAAESIGESENFNEKLYYRISNEVSFDIRADKLERIDLDSNENMIYFLPIDPLLNGQKKIALGVHGCFIGENTHGEPTELCDNNSRRALLYVK
jgi:hypothetical protein